MSGAGRGGSPCSELLSDLFFSLYNNLVFDFYDKVFPNDNLDNLDNFFDLWSFTGRNLNPADGSCRRRQNVVLVVIVVVNLKHAALHEEGGYEGGDDRQDEVANLLGGNVLE